MKTIVEIGAHRGVETLKFLEDAEARIFAFEPDFHDFIDLNILSQSYPRLTVLPFAVDIGDNQEPLFHYPEGLSTLQPPWGKGNTSFRMVWTIRLDTFMRLYAIDKIDYLRIDAPLREEMCLESLGSYVDCVDRGRIRLYEDQSPIPAWLLDACFNIEKDTTSDNVLRPDVKFWRT